MNIGRRIAERRKVLRLTQNELAERVGVSFQAVSSWERGEYLPDLEKLERIAESLDTSVAFLVEEQKAPTGAWKPKERMFSEKSMYTFVRSAAVSRNLGQTMKALPLMKYYHAGQTRKGREDIPYIIHPLMMACHCLALGLSDDEILATVLLHDVCEDCHVEPEALPVTDAVKRSIAKLTFEVRDGETKEQAKARYFAAIPGDRVATIVKVVDRCNNISTMAVSFSKQKIAQYIEETEQYVMPLLAVMKNMYPECYNAAFLLKYQMLGILESLKSMLARA